MRYMYPCALRMCLLSILCMVQVTSRLYSAIAAGCLPVVSDQLSGAFASAVRYGAFWLQAKEHTILDRFNDGVSFNFSDPAAALLHRLRAEPRNWIAARRRVLEAAVADVVYDAPSSRVGDNFVRLAHQGCLLGESTRMLALRATRTDPRTRPLNCTCPRARAPNFWWSDAEPTEHSRHVHGVPTELCRACADCRKACTSAELKMYRVRGDNGESTTT